MSEATARFEVPEGARVERTPRRRAITTGLIAGAGGIYLGATGILARFNERNLLTGGEGDPLITLGYAMLFMVIAFAGYRAGKHAPRSTGGPALGALTGAVAGATLALFVLVMRGFVGAGLQPNEILVEVNPTLLDEILSFGQTLGIGVAILIIGGAVLGGLSASLHLIGPEARRPIETGLVALLAMSMMEPLLDPVFGNLEVPTDWLYRSKGLTILGAIVVFAVAAGLSWFLIRRGGRTLERPTRPVTQEATGGLTPRTTGERLVLGLGLITLVYSLVLLVQTFSDQQIEPTLLLIGFVLGAVALVVSVVASRAATKAGIRRAPITFGLFAGAAGFFVILPMVAGSFISEVLTAVGLYVLLGLGLNIVVGYAGLLDLGYVAFFAIGAYSVAILTSRASFLVVETGQGVSNLQYAEQGFTNFWVALPITVVVAVFLGILIGAPVLRLRGDYLAIVTLGFGEIIRVLVASRWLEKWLGGAQGVIQIPAIPPVAWDLREPARIYYLILAFCFLAAFISYRLVNARVGRAWAAMREDESVAEAMGVSIIKYKLLAFAMGAGIGCLGGAFFAAKIGSIFPNSFDLLVSINVLAVIVLGGMGSIPGVIVGSVVLVGLPEVLRELAEYRLLFYGAILVAIMILRPEGLLPNVRRRRELHERELEEEQFEERGGEPSGEPVIMKGTEEGTT